MTESLWVSWKNRILGNGDAEAFDPFDPHVLKSPPDPTSSHALRTRSARPDLGHIAIHGTGVPDLVGDLIAVRLRKLDRIGRTVAVYPPDPSDRHRTHTHAIHWLDRDRHHMAVTMADIGSELNRLPFLPEDDAR